MNDMGGVGVHAIPGREEEAREIMEGLGYKAEPERTSWLVPFLGATYPAARAELIERLSKHDGDWSDSLTVGDLPDHPDAQA